MSQTEKVSASFRYRPVFNKNDFQVIADEYGYTIKYRTLLVVVQPLTSAIGQKIHHAPKAVTELTTRHALAGDNTVMDILSKPDHPLTKRCREIDRLHDYRHVNRDTSVCTVLF